MPGEFKEISSELNSLDITPRELRDEAETPSSLLNRRGVERKDELETILYNISGVLKELQDLVARYHSLGRHQKKNWGRFVFAGKYIQRLRGKLVLYTSTIGLFMTSLSTRSLARKEHILEDLVKEIKEGNRDPTIVSVHDTDDDLP